MRNKIELYREARLWITKVIIPLAGMATLYFSNPDNRADFKTHYDKQFHYKSRGQADCKHDRNLDLKFNHHNK